MRIRHEVRLAVGALLGFQLVATGAAVTLLGRMSPAIDRILIENVASVKAVEQMLTELIVTTSTVADRRSRFNDALELAKNNITEPGEIPLLFDLEQVKTDALARNPDPAAVKQAVDLLLEISEINARSMRIANDRAQRLGIAGAWAETILGLSAFALAILFARRFDRKIVQPFAELVSATRDWMTGDRYRRARAEGAFEISELARAFNDLLDRVAPLRRERARSAQERALLNHLLDRMDTPMIAVDATGVVVAANRAGLDRLDVQPELPRALVDVPSGVRSESIADVKEIVPDELWLATVTAPPEEEA